MLPNFCSDFRVLSKISPSPHVLAMAMIITAAATHIACASGSPGILGITCGPLGCSVGAKGMVSEFAIEGTESCSRASRKSETSFDHRPDGHVGGGVEEVGARFEAINVRNADDRCGGGAVWDLIVSYLNEIIIYGERKVMVVWSGENDSDCKLSGDSHGTDTENQANADLGPTIHL
jgi:hypothetical protein